MFLIVLCITPSLMAADLDRNETVVEAASEHEAEYDEVVNIADDSSVANPDTWEPGASGIWVGSSTEESLYRFSDVTYPGSGDIHSGARMGLAFELVFSRNQIMSGVAEFTMRLPTYNPGGTLWLSYMEIYQLSPGATYEFVNNTGWGSPKAGFYPYITGGYTDVGSWSVNFNDTSYTDGNQQWTIDGRTYVHMILPIFPEVRYLFFLNIICAPDSNFALYLSPQDIVSDGRMNTSVALRNYDSSYDSFITRFETLPVDCGFSFDLQAGMGGGVYAKRFTMEAGDEIEMEVHVQQTGTIDGYHNFMVPFESDDAINVTVDVSTFYEGPYGAIEDYTIDALNYKDYILASSGDSSIDDSITTTRDFTADLTITFNEPAVIMVYFRAYPGMEWLFSMVKGQVCWMSIWCDYQVAANIAVPSNDITSGVPINPLPQTLDPWDMFASVIITMLFPGVAIATAYYDYVTGGDSVAGWLVSKAGEILYAGATYIYGMVKNAIDAAWNFLRSIGEFIWAVGEWLYDSLVWLAEQIVEYGAILLSVLCLAVVLVLSYFAIWGQIKLWSMGYKLAKGDLEGAASEGGAVVRTVGGLAGRKPGVP
jgi:hypothetical protein